MIYNINIHLKKGIRFMKKLIIFLIMGMMLLSMTGCQEEASSSNTGNTGVLKV